VVSRLNLVHDKTYERELLVSNKSNGWRDLIAKVDLSTYRRIPWERNVPFFLVRFITPETGDALAVDPRTALRSVVEKAESSGWTCMSGAEFEVRRYALRTRQRKLMIVLPVQGDAAVGCGQGLRKAQSAHSRK
jgi:glutamine synthetase